MNTTYSINRTYETSAKAQSIGTKVLLFVVLGICSLAVFLFAPNYYQLFPTNGNTIYAGCLSFLFLIAAILFKHNEKLSKFWGIAYAFFIASVVTLVSNLFSGYNTDFAQLFGPLTGENKAHALGKVYDTLLVVIPILVLTLVSGADLHSLFLKIGNVNFKWGFGIGALVLVNYFTSVLIFFGSGYEIPKLGSAIVWGVVFSFSNSLLEELWVRGIFLQNLVPLIGIAGAVLLTSITFAAMHFLGVAYLPAAVIPVFVINTFTLGLECGVLMLKTDS